ncbi:MAG TPA: Panacea domain-containing protein [Stellaceae bacterium]|nr:Panacea domain-containing protein [Stellaceae bacterium]
MHYICWKCQDPTKLGATKLNKVLWLSDAHAFMVVGQPITEAKYVKQQFGPVPGAILPTLRELQREAKIAVRDVEYFGRPKREFFALQRPDISMFTADDISLVDAAIDFVCENHTAASISEATHTEIWKLAEIGEEMPLRAVLAANLAEITDADVRWAEQQRGRKRQQSTK